MIELQITEAGNKTEITLDSFRSVFPLDQLQIQTSSENQAELQQVNVLNPEPKEIHYALSKESELSSDDELNLFSVHVAGERAAAATSPAPGSSAHITARSSLKPTCDVTGPMTVVARYVLRHLESTHGGSSDIAELCRAR
ncbi:hypothetical protein Q8A73_004005 [Channa argus]|nr:hypothetical protein Q8A73_004005 [Channa argus]